MFMYNLNLFSKSLNLLLYGLFLLHYLLEIAIFVKPVLNDVDLLLMLAQVTFISRYYIVNSIKFTKNIKQFVFY